MTRRVLVVGGGITGLSAAWQAARDGAQVTVLESSERLGGLLRTSGVELPDGPPLRIDEGADAFLARVPEALELCDELGLSDRLTEPRARRAMVLTPSGLRWFPEETVLGVPLRPEVLEAGGLLSAPGVEAVAAEERSPVPELPGDVSVGSFVRSRYGHELVERVVGPLVGGINAGDVEEMSLRAVTPQLADAADAAAAAGTSLTSELRRRGVGAGAGPVFHSLPGGTGELVEALVAGLRRTGVRLCTATAVERVELSTDEAGQPCAEVVTTRGDRYPADRVVVTTPASHAAALLAGVSADAAAGLAAIPTASVAMATMVWRTADLPAQAVDTAASGFLVPRDAGLLLTAASFGSAKWAAWDDGEHTVVRVSAGHRRDHRPEGMDDDTLVAAMLADLATATGIRSAPVATRLTRWPGGFHQYTVGHLGRIEGIERALARDSGGIVTVAGAACRGLGIPACIRQGRAAAQ